MSNKVAILLVNWNSCEHTINCIESLFDVHYHNYTIIIIDNGSTDGSVETLKRKYTGIVIIESPTNLGFAGGNNLGVRYAITHGYAYCLFLNNDTFAEPDFLGILVGYMNEHPGTGAIQPRIFFQHNRSLLWNGGSYYNRWLGNPYTKGYGQTAVHGNNSIEQVHWITGCAFFARTAVLQQCGLLAENMFLYYEDVDLSFRIHAAGYRLMFHPDAVVYHIAGMSGKKAVADREGFMNPVVHYYNVRNRIWLLKKYTPILQWPLVFGYNCFRFLGIAAYFFIRMRPLKLKMVVSGIRDGFSGKIMETPE